MSPRFSQKVSCYDCPECHLTSSVKIFICSPEIWKCSECLFCFEHWELLKYQNESCQVHEPLAIEEAVVLAVLEEMRQDWRQALESDNPEMLPLLEAVTTITRESLKLNQKSPMESYQDCHG
jgi:hypothetical protein